MLLIMSYIDLAKMAKPRPVLAISEGEVPEIKVALPSASEETAFVEQLDAEIATIDTATAATREIKLLRELRERLVADMMTGKVDVREAATVLPEEPQAEVPADEAQAVPEEQEEALDVETVDEEA